MSILCFRFIYVGLFVLLFLFLAPFYANGKNFGSLELAILSFCLLVWLIQGVDGGVPSGNLLCKLYQYVFYGCFLRHIFGVIALFPFWCRLLVLLEKKIDADILGE
jgi:hypothetical protein